MPDIYHTFAINASATSVFEGFSSPKELDNWWTKNSEGKAAEGETYQLYFGPEYNWKAVVTKCKANKEFELQITDAHDDWLGTTVGVILKDGNGTTEVSFYHSGWPENNEHYRISCYCWAMYLRILKRYLEHGEHVPYEDRLTS